jgi:predicted ferric reductase
LILASTLPFLILFQNLDFALLASDSKLFWTNTSLYAANILGFIGVSLLIWEFVLGVRFLVALITDDLIWVNKLHGWIGKYGMLLIFIHPLLEMYAYFENWVWIFVPDISSDIAKQITFGRIAFILLILIYFTSALARGKIKYRPWLYIHYLAYPLMFLTFLHALKIGTFLNQYVYLKALWFTMLALYMTLLVVRLALFSGIFKPKYKLIKKYKQTNDLLILVFQPLGKKLIPKPGQYFYLQLNSFGESHPFSIMQYDRQNGDLIFGLKVVGKFTQKLYQLDIESIINIDGPYGVFTLEAQNYIPKVIIAGGVGATPFIQLIEQYDSGSTVFINANRHLDEALARSFLKNKMGNRYIDFISQDKINTGENIVNSRIDENNLAEILGRNNINRLNYFVCGSARFNKGIKQILQNLKVPKSQIYIEDFSF